MQTLLQDTRYALRQLRNAPAFAITAILTLALGIGANTAIFSLLDQALLRSLPVREPKSLVILEGTGKAWEGHSSGWGGDSEAYFSYPMYKDMRDMNQTFAGLVATSPTDVALTRAGASEMVSAELVSGNYFDLLGVKPALGQVLTQSEDKQQDGSPVVVLSYEFWKGHLGADPHVIGENISISGHPFQIIGVSAPAFRSAVWGQRPAVFIPMSMVGQVAAGRPKRLNDHKDKWLNIIGRLKPGQSRTQAEAAMQPLWHSLRAEELRALGSRSKHFTDDFLTNSRLRVLPGARGFSYDRENYKKPLYAVMAMALLVLLMAAVNVASLLLVRAAGRVQEFSLRLALGAEIKRIVQQLLLEGVLIGIAGGCAGVLLAGFAIRALLRHLTGDDGLADFSASVDFRLLLFNFAIALLVSVLFSLAPTVQLRRPNLSAGLGQRSATGAGGALSLRRVVVCLQIGLSVVLLVGAGLFVRTMQKLRAVDVGFNTTHLVSFGINPKLAGYAPEAVTGMYQQITDRLSALAGVQMVAATDDPELAGHDHGGNVSVDGYKPAPEEDMDVEKSSVSENYFSALQIPLLAGRYFDAADARDHAPVAIVNEAFVKHFCTSIPSCLGRQMADGGGDHTKLDIQIVGIVRDSKHDSLRENAGPTRFRPINQMEDVSSLFFYLRTVPEPENIISGVRGTMQQIDSRLALSQLGTMDKQIDNDLSNDTLVMLLAVSFGVLAVLLAGVGIYGVLAYSTTQRTREIGIRIALGSSRLNVARIVLKDVLGLAGIGVAIALPAAYGLSHLLQSQLFGVSPADPFALISAVLLVALIALVAALIPAQRAATVDPMQALRTE